MVKNMCVIDGMGWTDSVVFDEILPQHHTTFSISEVFVDLFHSEHYLAFKQAKDLAPLLSKATIDFHPFLCHDLETDFPLALRTMNANIAFQLS